MNRIYSKKAPKHTESTMESYEHWRAEQAYKAYKASRVDRSHLVKYPQSVEPSEYYLYLQSRALWS
ncbi:hypothetical protein B4W72_12000 [Staphylococcus delphini]|nr:hypothetical protein B4W72_12000 [Staphylococcus delphini]